MRFFPVYTIFAISNTIFYDLGDIHGHVNAILGASVEIGLFLHDFKISLTQNRLTVCFFFFLNAF